MSDKFILNKDNQPVAVDSVLEWGRWFERTTNRVVAQDETQNGQVSTVFIGLDHSFGTGPPLLFETMVFGGTMDGQQDRYSTWDEAKAGHAAMLQQVLAAGVAPKTKINLGDD